MPNALRRWLGHTGPEYTVGTLTYTRLGLFLMFAWLLWGDLVWTLMEFVFPASMPLQLDRLGVPRDWIGYMMGTAGAVINMTFVPVISFRSDRTRTRWGRRIPYLLVTMPFLCAFLAVLGFSDHVGAWIRSSSWPARLHLSPLVMIVIVMGVLILLYDVFNVFVNSVYWYLFRDVIPSAFLGRFMAAFRMVGTLATMLWGAFIYGHIETQTPAIYVTAAIVYFVGFGLMCLMVKEGRYPAPEDYVQSEAWLRKVIHAIRTYARECFSHPVFVTFYFAQALFYVGTAGVMYKQFFYLRHLQFTTADLGRVTAIMSPVLLAFQLPMGWLVDKVHPIRTYLIGATAIVPVYFAGYFVNTYSIWGYTLHAFTMFVSIQVLQLPLAQLNASSDVPLMMRLFPLKQYGQFSSAQAMLRHFSMIFGTIAGATFMGWTNREYGDFGNAYACLWHGTFQALGAACLWIVYFYWRRHGAEKFHFEVEEATPGFAPATTRRGGE
jgi:Na+/melibiose symporter-like transporter